MSFTLTQEQKNIFKSWRNLFIVAALSAFLVAFGDKALDWADLQYIVYAGVIAVVPVIINYFGNDPRYGKNSNVNDATPE